ncbi:MAG: NYN domain-containing protein [Nocardioides sp.]|nr:NYN domain-containing protein [Nocardioides sp.]
MTDATRVAVLIDCDNISHRWARAILGEAAKHGTLGIKRGYGDWTSDRLKNWRPELATYAVQPVQQFAYTIGKNSTDFALVIDAMDLLYSGTVDVFCIVSSDSDFTRLAMRLRESGKRVHGIGARKTPEAFQNACDRFTYVEVLVDAEDLEPEQSEAATARTATKAAMTAAKATAKKATAKKTPTKKAASTKATASTRKRELDKLTALFLPAVEANAKDDGWAPLSAVGSYVVNTNPTFDSRNYGYSKLSNLVRDLPRLEVQDIPVGNGLSVLHVRESGSKPRKRG